MFISDMLDNIMQQYDIIFLDFCHWLSATEEIAAYKSPPHVMFMEIMLCLLNTRFAHVNPNDITSSLRKWKQVAALSATNLQYFAPRFYSMELLDIRHVIIR